MHPMNEQDIFFLLKAPRGMLRKKEGGGGGDDHGV